MSHELFEQVFSSRYGNKYLDAASDKAVLKIGKNRIAFTSDAFVMSPRRVPGCSLGSLSVFGTVNDLKVVCFRAMGQMKAADRNQRIALIGDEAWLKGKGVTVDAEGVRL